MREREQPAWAVTGACFGIFSVLGIVVASYGPSLQYVVDRFNVTVSVAGLVVTAHFLGEIIGLAGLGLTHARWRLGQRLAAGTALFGIGLLMAAAAPTWPLLLFAVFVLGVGAGGLVVLINLYFATRFGARSPAMVSLVNTAYGVGTFVGPAAVAITRGYSPVFAVCGAAALACIVFVRRAADDAAMPSLTPAGVHPRAIGLVVAFAALLLVYEAIEVGVGTWEATDLAAFGSSAQFAAAATSIYWGAFTLGRVLCAPFAMRWTPQRLLVPALVMTTLLLIAIRLRMYPPVAYALVGLFAGPIFPVAVSWMARVVPNATNAVTYSVLGALIGGALLPAALGGLIGLAGIDALPLGIAVCSLAALAMVGVISVNLPERP